MFERLNELPADPLLKLIVQHREDTRADKVDLGVGVYKDAAGNTPVMAAIAEAERQLLAEQTTKSYIGPAGSPDFCSAIGQLLLGENHPVLRDNRLSVAQTPGGCGALRMAAELLVESQASTTWVSTPTWVNHLPLLGKAGLSLAEYPYYDFAAKQVDFAAMQAGIDRAAPGDVVLLHGCCHNPSGADLSPEQWQSINQQLLDKQLIPFVDIAYQGLADGLDADAYGLRLLAEHHPEMLIAASCSKNFGLYRERTGAILAISANAEQARVTSSQLFNIIRACYSMPPDHGAALVARVLTDSTLNQSWQNELESMRLRICGLRQQLADGIAAAGASRDFSYIAGQKGMFSFLGISEQQVDILRDEHAIYMASSSRISLAGLNSQNIDKVAASVAAVVG